MIGSVLDFTFLVIIALIGLEAANLYITSCIRKQTQRRHKAKMINNVDIYFFQSFPLNSNKLLVLFDPSQLNHDLVVFC